MNPGHKFTKKQRLSRVTPALTRIAQRGMHVSEEEIRTFQAGASEQAIVPTDPPEPQVQAPVRAVFNRTVVTALVFTFGLHLTFGE